MEPRLNSFPRTTRDWNVLPADLSTFYTLDTFKSCLNTKASSLFLTSSCLSYRKLTG